MGLFAKTPKSKFVQNGNISVKPFDTPDPKEHLSILSYNMGFAVGPVQKTVGDTIPHNEYIQNLNEIVRVVRETESDILLLQEVDLNSRRSHRLNQLDYLQDQLKWSHAAYTNTWKTYAPFDSIGKVHECAAILSRYPILKHEAQIYTFNPQLKNKLLNFCFRLCVWQSPMQYAQIAIQDKKLNVFNLHLDVFDRNNRVLQIENLIDWIKQSDRAENLIFGGDLNYHAELGREKKTDFEGYDPNAENLPPFFQNIWQEFPGLQEAFIHKDSTREQIHQHVTFPELNKCHDFIFFSRDFENVSSTVIDTISSSDHLPVHTLLQLRN